MQIIRCSGVIYLLRTKYIVCILIKNFPLLGTIQHDCDASLSLIVLVLKTVHIHINVDLHLSWRGCWDDLVPHASAEPTLFRNGTVALSLNALRTDSFEMSSVAVFSIISSTSSKISEHKETISVGLLPISDIFSRRSSLESFWKNP